MKNKEKNKRIRSCCTHEKKDKQCIRTKDKKVFDLPRKVDREICLSRDIKGFSMKSSCAPYRDCSRKQFLYNKDQKTDLVEKYELLKNISGIIDISDALDNSKKLSYVDGVHYSPNANNKIAHKIYDIIFDKK